MLNDGVSMRRVGKLLGVLTSLMTLSAMCQEPAAQFHARSSLVLLPTVVTDRSGVPVTGLKKEDFYVAENKHSQKISIFEEITTSPGQIRRVDPHDSGFTNAVAPEAKAQRLTLILLDTLNTQFADQVRARRELLKLVEETLKPDEPVALMNITSRGLNVLNDFTTDPTVLAAAIRKVRAQESVAEKNADEQSDMETMLDSRRLRGRAPVTQDMIADELNGFQHGAFERFQQYQLDNSVITTLQALRQIAESFSGVPGRKSLLWITGGLPFEVDDADSFRLGRPDLFTRYEGTWNALNDAQITVYPLDMGGLFNPGYISPRFRRVVRRRRSFDSVSNLEILAGMTGGRFCEHKQTVSTCYSEAQQDALHYYLIGYYMDTSQGKPGWRKLDVAVSRPQLQVRARSSYYVPDRNSDPARQERGDLDSAILSPIDFTAVPMLVRWTGQSSDAGKVSLNFRFNVPSAGLTLEDSTHRLALVFAAFAKTPKGNVAGESVKELQGNLSSEMAEQVALHGVVYDGTLSLPSGKYTVRFVVRDNASGRIGTVTVPLDTQQLNGPN